MSSYLHVVTFNWETTHEYAEVGEPRVKRETRRWLQKGQSGPALWADPHLPIALWRGRALGSLWCPIMLLPLPGGRGSPNDPQPLSNYTDPQSNMYMIHKAISRRSWQCDKEINKTWAQGQTLFQTLSLIRWLRHSSGCRMFSLLSLPGCRFDLSGNGSTSHLRTAVSRFLGENRLRKHLVSLPCIYLLVHAWSFVSGVTQAYHTQSSNKLKIAPAEISTSYFPAGVQSRLFCLSQNI